jgi:calcineurin-like phosphoesterase
VIVLFFGDVIGKPGRDLLTSKLPELRKRYAADAVIANGENATDGKGIKPAHADGISTDTWTSNRASSVPLTFSTRTRAAG